MMINPFQNNPLFQRAVQMSQGKSEEELKGVANNLCKQMGIDFNAAYNQFQQQMNNINNMFGGMNR